MFGFLRTPKTINMLLIKVDDEFEHMYKTKLIIHVRARPDQRHSWAFHQFGWNSTVQYHEGFEYLHF